MPITPSPMRYPGGKTVLYNRVKDILLRNNIANDSTYIEPFAGGSGLALKLLFNGDVSNIVINDYDFAIYCVWDNILNYTGEAIDFILNVNITMNEWFNQKNIYSNRDKYSNFDLGMATLFLNRTNHSGVITGGPIGGKNQLGKFKLDCRFNKKSIVEKIKYIADQRNKIKLLNLDVSDFIRKIIPMYKDNGFIYFDPPYINKGPLLYRNYFENEDHEKLSVIILNELCDYRWIVTYDNDPLVFDMYNTCRLEQFTLAYSAGKVKHGGEVMIYSNFLRY